MNTIEKLLCEPDELTYTDAQAWNEWQRVLAGRMESLLQQEGSTPDEEAELVLTVLMGYTVVVRNSRNIAKALERAERVFPLIKDPVLKCRLAVFCYGECWDEELAQEAHTLIDTLKKAGRGKDIEFVETLLQRMEENSNDY